jgi:hypothetical protein
LGVCKVAHLARPRDNGVRFEFRRTLRRLAGSIEFRETIRCILYVPADISDPVDFLVVDVIIARALRAEVETAVNKRSRYDLESPDKPHNCSQKATELSNKNDPPTKDCHEMGTDGCPGLRQPRRQTLGPSEGAACE